MGEKSPPASPTGAVVREIVRRASKDWEAKNEAGQVELAAESSAPGV